MYHSSQSLSQLLSQRPLTPITSSIEALDRSLSGGFVPGLMYEVASLNGAGRAPLAEQLAFNALHMGKKVLWISCVKEIQSDRFVDTIGDKLISGNLTTIRINTTAKLYLYFQCVMNKKNYGLVVIDELSIILAKNLCDLNDAFTNTIPNAKKRQNLIEIEKHKVLRDILKPLSTYAMHNKSVICLLTPVEPNNMSFVETPTTSIPSSLSSPSTSSSFSSQVLTPPSKPKVLYQQVLSSSLGDHPSWNSFIRARLTLYKDWIHGHTETAIFIHIKHNSTMRKFIHYGKNTQNMDIPLYFEIDRNFGIKHVVQNNWGCNNETSSDTRGQPFLLSEDDLRSSDIEPEEETERDIILHSTALSSSPHIEITNSKVLISQTDSASMRLNEAIPAETKQHTYIKPGQDTQQNEDEDYYHYHYAPGMTRDITHETTLGSDAELEELNVELEELYPTQQEALTVEELTQLSQSMLPKIQKRKQASENNDNLVFRKPKLVALNYDGATTVDEPVNFIPSSAPFY